MIKLKVKSFVFLLKIRNVVLLVYFRYEKELLFIL